MTGCEGARRKQRSRVGRLSIISQCPLLEVWVLVDLGGAQRVSSVDSGGGRGADVGLVGELGLVLAVVQCGRGQHPVAHADGHLVHQAGRVAPVLHRVARRALRRHQVGHGAAGAQGGRRRVGVQVGLAGQVGGGGGGCRKVRMHVARVRGAVVVEGVRGLGGDGRGDVGLLPPVAACPLGYHVLLGLQGRGRGAGIKFCDLREENSRGAD